MVEITYKIQKAFTVLVENIHVDCPEQVLTWEVLRLGKFLMVHKGLGFQNSSIICNEKSLK